jgi:hypothetical protein
VAKYLKEDEAGFDTAVVGFPGLGGCMAVALLTDQGIYGWHSMPGRVARAAHFNTFIQTVGLHGTFQRLYGSCYWPLRYGGKINGMNLKQQWENEMSQIAAAIGYNGKVSGFDISSSSHVEASSNANTYLEYSRSPGDTKCRISFKRSSKMQTPVTGNYDPLAADPVHRLGPGGFAAPLSGNLVTGMAVVTTTSNKGKLHTAGPGGIHSFTV